MSRHGRLRLWAACAALCALTMLAAGSGPEVCTAEYFSGGNASSDAGERPSALDAALLLAEFHLDVEPVLQLPELPNGCEITSLTTVLNYYGFDVDKETLAAEYLPYEYFTFDGYEAVAPDPEEAYAGDPFATDYAYYCYAQPIASAANAFFADCGADYTATDETGATFDDLIGFLLEGRPSIIWATLHFEPPAKGGFWWRTEDGDVIEAYSNLHCLVLTGFDEAFMYLCDPLVGKITVSADVFAACYTDMGSCSVVLDRAPDKM